MTNLFSFLDGHGFFLAILMIVSFYCSVACIFAIVAGFFGKRLRQKVIGFSFIPVLACFMFVIAFVLDFARPLDLVQSGNWVAVGSRYEYNPDILTVRSNHRPEGWSKAPCVGYIRWEHETSGNFILDFIDNTCIVQTDIGEYKQMNFNELEIKSIVVDSWLRHMPEKWKRDHYTFYMWEFGPHQRWSEGHVVKYGPVS